MPRFASMLKAKTLDTGSTRAALAARRGFDHVTFISADWRIRRVTTANMITIVRFLLVPAVVFALMTDKMGWALAGFVIAGVSDGIDGFIARHYNQRSELGAYMDPMADKLLLVSVFVVLGYMDELPLWLVIAAVSRDALIVGAVLLSTIMRNPVEMKPLYVSKANTAVQIVLAATVLAELAFTMEFGLVRPVLIAVSGLLTVTSAAAYLVGWLRHMSGYGESKSPNNG
jgi:cardiolipin synthase (CMP-forming)